MEDGAGGRPAGVPGLIEELQEFVTLSAWELTEGPLRGQSVAEALLDPDLVTRMAKARPTSDDKVALTTVARALTALRSLPPELRSMLRGPTDTLAVQALQDEPPAVLPLAVRAPNRARPPAAPASPWTAPILVAGIWG